MQRNTLVTISDNKIGVSSSNANLADFYEARVLSATDYYAFGMSMKERSFQPESYRYGYQGSEKNEEMEDTYTTEYRQLNTTIGRWFSIDPKATAHESPYVSMGNNPILMNDILGDTSKIYDMDGNFLEEINDGTDRHIKVDSKLFYRYKVMYATQGLKIKGSFYEHFVSVSYVRGNFHSKLMSDPNYANQFLRNYQILAEFEGVVGKNNQYAYYTESTGAMEMEFSGNMRNTSDLNLGARGQGLPPLYAQGTLSLSVIFTNGSSLKIQEYSAISGPWGTSALPNGIYEASRITDDVPSGMVRHGMGYGVQLSNSPEYHRDGLFIHPDADPSPGTQGCIGLQESLSNLTIFRNTMRNYFNAHRNQPIPIRLNVNIVGNPNYANDPNTGRRRSNGE